MNIAYDLETVGHPRNLHCYQLKIPCPFESLNPSQCVPEVWSSSQTSSIRKSGRKKRLPDNLEQKPLCHCFGCHSSDCSWIARFCLRFRVRCHRTVRCQRTWLDRGLATAWTKFRASGAAWGSSPTSSRRSLVRRRDRWSGRGGCCKVLQGVLLSLVWCGSRSEVCQMSS